jgi:hypothetical protein
MVNVHLLQRLSGNFALPGCSRDKVAVFTGLEEPGYRKTTNDQEDVRKSEL